VRMYAIMNNLEELVDESTFGSSSPLVHVFCDSLSLSLSACLSLPAFVPHYTVDLSASMSSIDLALKCDPFRGEVMGIYHVLGSPNIHTLETFTVPGTNVITAVISIPGSRPPQRHGGAASSGTSPRPGFMPSTLARDRNSPFSSSPSPYSLVTAAIRSSSREAPLLARRRTFLHSVLIFLENHR
jgi:hypothetical protein